MSNTYIDDIRTIASELSDMSPKTQMEIVKKCKDICGNVADAIETEVANEIADETATLQTQITTNTNNIATNASNIAINANDIATNVSDIETLESAVATNTSNIATNASNIATNTTNIATNTTNIETINETLDTKADLENTSQDIIANTFNAKDSDYYYTEYGTGTITNKTGRYLSKIITLPIASSLNETCTLATTDDIPEIEANPSDDATDTLSTVNIDGTVYEVSANIGLYLHHITSYGTNPNIDGTIYVSFDLYTSSETALTLSEVITLLSNSGYSYTLPKSCGGYADNYMIAGVYGGSTTIGISLIYFDSSSTALVYTNAGLTYTTNFTDTVTQIF